MKDYVMNRSASSPAVCRRSEKSLAAALMLAGLRITIGWHFLYEGVAKWMQPDWSAGGYLEASRWLLADLYHWMASNAAVLKVVNLLNI
jgi:uncharacterized membrane protein YphA (DoxX/SURF4 family)